MSALLSSSSDSIPGQKDRLCSLPHPIDTQVDERLDTLGSPVPAGLARKIRPTADGGGSDARRPDTDLDGLLGPRVVEEGVGFVQTIVRGVSAQEI
jgi:hypothetical protein